MKNNLSTRRKARHKTRKGKGNSRYARKREYLNIHGGWGWEYKEPKPWK